MSVLKGHTMESFMIREMPFYILRKNDFRTEKGFAETEYLPVHPTSYGEPLYCPECGKMLTGMEWLPPFQIDMLMYKQFGNLAFRGSDLIADEHFRRCYSQSGLTGLEFIGDTDVRKIKCYNGVRKKSLSEPPKYYVTRLKYGCAAIDHQKSDSIFKTGCEPTCNYCRRGLIEGHSCIVIDESTWDGTDIFLARGMGGTVTVSQRFKDWWDSCRFNNGKVIPSEEAKSQWRVCGASAGVAEQTEKPSQPMD